MRCALRCVVATLLGIRSIPFASPTIPTDAKDKQLHLILEVWDDNEIVNLVDYRRVVIDVN